MQVAVVMDNPQGTKEIYEKVKEELGLSKPAGGILHVAGPRPDGGWRVIEIFETQEQAKAFLKDRLGPAFREIGAASAPQPEFWPIYHVMSE